MSELRYADKIIVDTFWGAYLQKTLHCKYNVAIGAYRSSKSTFNILAFSFYLNRLDYEGLHLCLASSSSVAQTIIADGSGFGLSYIFAERCSKGVYKDLDCMYITNAKGYKQTLLFLGGSKVSDFQRFRGFSVDGIIMEEADLLHENTIKEAAGRTWASKQPFYVLSSNPCSDKIPYRQWINELSQHTPGDVNFIRSSIYDNPALTVERIDEITRSYDPNSIFYKKFILGEDAQAEGLIYKLDEQNYIDEVASSRYLDYIVVIDPGKTKSATGMIAMGKNVIEHTIDVVRECRHRNNDNMSRVYTSSDYARLSVDFIKDVANVMKKWPKLVIVDSFKGDDFYENFRKECIANRLPINIKFPIKSDGKDGKDEVTSRITRGLDLLYRHKLRFNKQCKYTIDDFLSAVYDQKLIETKGIETRSDDYTSTGHGDMIDAVEYGFCYYSPQLNVRGW